MIVVEDAHYAYETASANHPPALEGVNLTIPDGAFLAVIGSNGSGKSTLARCLNGLISPTKGRVLVDGMDTADERHGWEVHRRVGMIFQNPDNQLVSTTVERELAFGLENLGIPSPEIRERVAWALDRFHFGAYRLSPPHRLSGGQKQRLAIAAVVIMQPGYLVCDEPTALLDPQGRADTLALIERLRHDHGMTIVYITQLPDEAVAADQVVMMARGSIVEEGPPTGLLTRSAYLESYGLGAPLTVRMADALRRRGVAVPADALRPEHLIAAVRQYRPSAVPLPPISTPPVVAPRPPYITLDGVAHTYQPGTVLATSALNGIDLNIATGQCVALIGSNGSGKSTLMQHLNGLLTPTTGTVTVDGQCLSAKGANLKAIRRKVGLIFQFPEAQLFEETVFDDVAFGPRQIDPDNDDLRDRVHQALNRVRLDPDTYAARSPFLLSSGEKRRVAIAGVLAMRPAALGLDEPTAGLDELGLRQIEGIISDFHASGGTTLLISHDMDLVARLTERVIVLQAGRVVADEPPSVLFTERARLTSFGLDCPGPTRLLMALRDAGYPVDTSRFDAEAAADEIARTLDLH